MFYSVNHDDAVTKYGRPLASKCSVADLQNQNENLVA